MTIKMKNIISITEARKEIFDIAEKAQKSGNHYMFTEGGKPKLAVMSADEYENLMEDLALENNPQFVARMKKAEEDFAKGEFVTWDEIKKKLARKHTGYVVADKPKKGYKVNKRKK